MSPGPEVEPPGLSQRLALLRRWSHEKSGGGSRLGVFENLDIGHHEASLQGGQLRPVQTRDLFDHLLTVLKLVDPDLASIFR